MKLVGRFKKEPTLYYALSICATWAGIGSLMNGVIMTQTYGAIPSAIWVLGNVLACIAFGVVTDKLPETRKVFQSKAMLYLCGLMCVFQSWLAMNGMQTVFEDTTLPQGTGTVVAYVLSVTFILILLKYGMIRNVLTDGVGWIVVYILAVGVTVAALITTKSMATISLGLNIQNMRTGIWKAFLLIPGPFTYPYFFEILNYNTDNSDGTKRVNAKRAYVLGGLMFALYMMIVYPLAWVQFSPVLNAIKAVLITIIGASTLSSAMYSIYIAFGKRAGLVINAALVIGWKWLIPLGVMGMWTLMANVRIYIVGGAILVALIWRKVGNVRKD